MDNELYLKHEGVSIKDGAPGRGSGRYPLGSGAKPYQHNNADFLSRIQKMKNMGMSESEIARALGIYNSHGEPGVSKLRAQERIAKNNLRMYNVETAKSLRAQGYGWTEIAKMMGLPNESSVRSLCNSESEQRMMETKATADILRERIDKVGMIDVGTGAERYLNVSRTKFDAALEMLEMEGYEIYGGRVPQVTNPGKFTIMKVIAPPGTEHKEIFDYGNIHSVQDFDVISHDDGKTFDKKFVYPESMDSNRLMIRYAEEGGLAKDGVIELRRGVEDLSLGESHYAQVRILVDGDRYLKGMAVYSDGHDMPDGVDVIFNTNKPIGTPKRDVMKEISTVDKNNPFGSLIKAGVNDPTNPNSPKNGGQSYYISEDGKKKLSLINKRSDEGDWEDWSKELPSQFLAKQKMELIKKQLKISSDNKKAEYDEIMSLTQPTVRKVLLEGFAKDCDASAESLKAAALPRQRYQVILPLTSIKDNEVFAPNFDNGEKVALVRFPHGGTFEIPILTVNNKNKEGKKVMTLNPKDAIGINSKVAERLSGADFDGDTVLVIPTNNGKTNITSTPKLKGLEGFDPKMAYPERKGMTYMKYTNKDGKKVDNTQMEMGKISNLITDMTIKGADSDKIARAVRHSMVVIDAGKHKLDYKKSEEDNGIKELRKEYLGRYDDKGNYHEGASTIISRAKSEVSVDKRQGEPRINKETGELSYKVSDKLYYTDPKTGKQTKRTQQSTQMAETKDARSLISEYHTRQEYAYADYANYMKSLANKARKESVNTKSVSYNKSARDTYSKEVDSLDKKLNLSLMNSPKERQAQYIANSRVEGILSDNPDLRSNKKELKKQKQMALEDARAAVGAKRTPIEITDREWEAIQAGAVRENKLVQILNNTDIDKLKERATPRGNSALTSAQISRINRLKASGYTNDEIAKAMHVSASTVIKYAE